MNSRYELKVAINFFPAIFLLVHLSAARRSHIAFRVLYKVTRVYCKSNSRLKLRMIVIFASY